MQFDVVRCAVEHGNIRDPVFVWFDQIRASRDVRIVDEADVSDVPELGTNPHWVFIWTGTVVQVNAASFTVALVLP